MTGTTARWIVARLAFVVVAACIALYVGNEAMAFGHMVTHIRHAHPHSHSHSATHTPAHDPATLVAVEQPDPADCAASLGTLRTGGDGRATACVAPAHGAVTPHRATTNVAEGRAR